MNQWAELLGYRRVCWQEGASELPGRTGPRAGGAGSTVRRLPGQEMSAVVMGEALTHQLVVLDELDTARRWEGTPLWCVCPP